jgi:hypothetical protein
MSIGDSVRSWIIDWLMPETVNDMEWRARMEKYDRNRSYYEGLHKRQIKQKSDQADDNLTLNFVGLIVDRSISMLLGDDVQFELEGEPEQEYIDEVMEANDEDVLLYDAAQNAAVYGTGYIKMVLGGAESKRTENRMLPRLITLDPRWMKIVTPPEDIGRVIGYEMRYNVGSGNELAARKEITEVFGRDENGQIASWTVSNYISNQGSGGRWDPMGEPVVWEYEFPPIIHWKNLPSANECYGRSDVEDVIELNDRINFVAGNISRVIRYHGHPKTWVRGSVGSKLSWGPDEMLQLNGVDATAQNLEMQSDLNSSREFYNDLRQALFDISRTVDITSMKDRVGQLTNFGLRVLYGDALAKLNTKRMLFGGALTELVHRLLVLEGMSAQPGQIEWQNPLPVSQTEQNETDAFDLDRELVSKETIATRRGYDWESESEKIAVDKTSTESVGSMVLRAFNQGQ